LFFAIFTWIPILIYTAFEHIPVIINQKTESGLRNGCKINQGYKTKIKEIPSKLEKNTLNLLKVN
jgi:hypothetical protein